MDTTSLKKFAQKARIDLLGQVGARLDAALAPDSLERSESPTVVGELEKAVAKCGREQVIEQAAYTWFNRLCALRFMDLRRYTGIGIVSPAECQIQPEILAEAKAGEIDETLVPEPEKRKRILDLLTGKYTNPDPQGEAYRLLLISACNHWHKILPFMFGRINDYTGLLLPNDLLSEKSVPAQILAAINADNCGDVEIIGWLYQFYISEKKDAIFANKNSKIGPADIPAATQLFTPHWIVRYLAENSLGRLWLLNRPDSALADEMPYFIAPCGEQGDSETDFLEIASPKDIKICDPACGSGHMLVYAFDLLYRIYQEEGYPEAEIPANILRNNLFGMEIDQRAGALAAFALMMKAREKQRNFFSRKIAPKILVLEKVAFTDEEKKRYMDFVGRDLFTSDLAACMDQFAEADNFGSLIRPVVKNAAQLREVLEKREAAGKLLVQPIHEKVLKILKMAEYLSPRYHVVIANPPYMGGRGMNARLAACAKENYPNSKTDLFAMFMERGLELVIKHGYCAMVTMQSWMFLSSFEALRARLFKDNTISSMAHFGARAFDSIGGEVVSTTAFVISKSGNAEFKGDFLRLTDGKSEKEKADALKEAIKNPSCGWFFRASAADFKKIPGSPIAYWVSGKIRNIFANNKSLGGIAEAKQGLATADNNRFVRNWQELNMEKIGFGKTSTNDALESGLKWFPYNKGGEFRKWYGNQEFVVNWENDGEEINDFKPRSVIRNPSFYFKETISWSKISSANIAMRYYPAGFIFDVAGCCISTENINLLYKLLAFTNTKLAREILKTLSPTLNFEVGHISLLPVVETCNSDISSITNIISLSKTDWDSYETSWDFTTLPLLSPDCRKDTLEATYAALREHWRQMTLEMQRLEEENNRVFIEAYGLGDELAPDVPLAEITLTCNPHYRYGGNKTEEELEALLLADAMREFVSYSVGCMFGRYALERPGLVLASQGQTLDDYNDLVPDAQFAPDDDNVIPILDGEYFRDDIVGRFRKFLRLTFGEEHFAENLAFVEKALGKDIRKYFLRDFYADHVKRYKKRPIYWLFQSPGGGFSALIYMHRYTPETVGIVQASYLRDFIAKLEAEKRAARNIEISGEATAAQKTRAVKKLAALQKTIAELEKYEREILYPLATRKIAIDLDDGVRVNYPKFGAALRKITGLEGGNED